jgi:hypothetical protein
MAAKKKFVTPSGAPVYGIVAEFATPADVYHAAEKVRDAGYSNWDLYAPFPIHGIDEAMGVKRTKLPMIVGFGAFAGAGLGFLMQWWMTAVDYQLVVQGKPYAAWEPFVPVTFELGVLLASFSAIIGMLALNGLPRHHHPLFTHDRFLKVSDDRFMICVEATDPKFDPESTRALLEKAHGSNVALIQDE